MVDTVFYFLLSLVFVILEEFAHLSVRARSVYRCVHVSGMSCSHCHLLSVFLTLLQSANDTEQLSCCTDRDKKTNLPEREGVQVKEQERGNENKVKQLSLLCFYSVAVVSPDVPRSPARCLTSTPRAGILLLLLRFISLSLSAGILPSLSLVVVVDVLC